MLVPNTRVMIHGDEGDAIGHVLDVCPVDEMLDLPGHPNQKIRDSLKEANVDHVALILYDYKSVPVVFSVLEIDGQWYDLLDRKLTFETIGVYRG